MVAKVAPDEEDYDRRDLLGSSVKSLDKAACLMLSLLKDLMTCSVSTSEDIQLTGLTISASFPAMWSFYSMWISTPEVRHALSFFFITLHPRTT